MQDAAHHPAESTELSAEVRNTNPAFTPGPWEIHPSYMGEQPLSISRGDGSTWLALDIPVSAVDESDDGTCGKIVAKVRMWSESHAYRHVDNMPEALANAAVICAAPELLSELQAAHQIIRNALAIMTAAQKATWGEKNALHDVDGEGVTRANERAAVIAKAMGVA